MDYSVLHNKKTKISSVNNEEIIDLLNLTFIIPENFSFEIFRVPVGYVARPDLICLDKYGTSQYVDIICKLNGISNPFELNEGCLIALPDTNCLNKFMYSKDTIDQDYDASDSDSSLRVKPKTVNESRQANEAVIGDKRYKIDKTNRVVIY
jgi:hypothetical protein